MARRSRWFRRLWWLAPPLTVLLILAVGHGFLELAQEPQPPDPRFTVEVPPPPPLAELRLVFRRPGGEPAPGALVVLLQPSLSVGRTGADGEVRLQHSAEREGPYRLHAYLEDHQLIVTEEFAAPPAEGFVFEELAPARIPRPEIEERRTRTVILQGSQLVKEDLLALCLVLAYPADEDPAVPWGALSGSGGEVFIEGTRLVPLALKIYAPLQAPVPAWLLHSAGLAAEEGVDVPAVLDLEWARLTVRGMPPDWYLEGERLDIPGALSHRAVPPEGLLVYEALPPGEYRFRLGDRIRELRLAPGANELNFALATR